jgi:hypothetical protein
LPGDNGNSYPGVPGPVVSIFYYSEIMTTIGKIRNSIFWSWVLDVNTIYKFITLFGYLLFQLYNNCDFIYVKFLKNDQIKSITYLGLTENSKMVHIFKQTLRDGYF